MQVLILATHQQRSRQYNTRIADTATLELNNHGVLTEKTEKIAKIYL